MPVKKQDLVAMAAVWFTGLTRSCHVPRGGRTRSRALFIIIVVVGLALKNQSFSDNPVILATEKY